MSDLVSVAPQRSGAGLWLRRLGLGLGLFGVVGLVAWAGLSMSQPAGPKHQVAKIMLLPDTPPPPPPPPPERPKVEQKTEMKQQLEKKLETPPEPQPLKMEGQAGEGPSPFTAGEVKNDYIGGDIGNGARFSAYVGRIAGLIQDELAKRNLRIADAKVLIWLNSDGGLQRYEITGVSADMERQLRTAMANFGRFPEAPPQDMPMPMGLEISER